MMADEEEETELVRVDSWMQSVVPSLPKRAAIVCLVFNILVPGLGTLTGGLLSCCLGRPRYDFHPARFRCPTAFLVMSIGVAQFLCIAFFFVGWLWSIMWGFLMLNLSDPKYRVLPKPPPPKKPPPGSVVKPTVKVEKAEKELSAGRKNFGRLIQKATDNKSQALGLAPPTTSSSSQESTAESTKSGSLFSRIPVISCAGSPRTFVANMKSKFSKLLGPISRSSSQSSLLSGAGGGGGGGDLESVAIVDGSVGKQAANWKRKRAAPSNASSITTAPSSPALSNGRVSTPVSEEANGESTFNGIVSVTPATPVHSSSDTSTFSLSSDSPSADDGAAPVSSQDERTAAPPTTQVKVESSATAEDLNGESVSEAVDSIRTDTSRESDTPEVVLPNTPDLPVSAEVLPEVTMPTTEVNDPVVPTTTTVEPISAKGFAAIRAAKINPAGLEPSAQKELRPKMKQSMTYHYDA